MTRAAHDWSSSGSSAVDRAREREAFASGLGVHDVDDVGIGAEPPLVERDRSLHQRWGKSGEGCPR